MDDQASERVPADHYRRQAAQARQLVDEAATPAVKQHLRDLAARFERLAEGVDEVASGRPYPANGSRVGPNDPKEKALPC
jgi:hypothetical protein